MPKDGKQYDRSAEDLGNIVGLEHVNLQVEDQGLTTLFYISGLGLTRDPYLMTSIDNMWVNVGRSQFHLITGKPQRLRGRTGLVDARSRGAAAAARQDEEAARGHALRLQGARRPRRGDVPLGQHARCSTSPAASAACSSACPMSSSTYRPARPRPSPTSTARSSVPPASVDEDGRRAGGAGRGRPRPAAGVPRDQGEARRPMTGTTSRSTSPTSRDRTSGCSSATSSPRRATSTSIAS